MATQRLRKRDKVHAMLLSLDPRNISLKEVICETWVVTHLAFELLYYLGSRLVWIWMFFRFLVYVSLLMVPFIRAGWIFLISDYIKRGIKYGPNPRNYLDIYFASDIMSRLSTAKNSETNTDEVPVVSPRTTYKGSTHDISVQNKYPVVIFLSGGAWMIGYKAWGAFMGMLLAQLGVIFVACDYRNFPQGTISDMVIDATNAVQWTLDNIEQYGGDKDNVYVISQSAGAHIGALMMLLQARKVAMHQKLKSHLEQLKRSRRRLSVHIINDRRTVHPAGLSSKGTDSESKILDEEIRSVEEHLNSSHFDALWDPERDLKAFVGIAGPYNLQDMKLYLDHRGLYSDILYSIMENDLRRASPFYCLYDRFISPRDNVRVLKPAHKIGRIDSEDPSIHFVSMTEIKVDAQELAMMEEDEAETKEQREGVEETLLTLHQLLRQKVELKLPSVYLFHGADDLSCPVSNTKTFSLALANYGVKTYIKIYANQSHTSPIIENPIAGKDPLCCDILQIIYPQQSLNDIVHEIEETMTGGLRIPQFVLDLATFVCPF